jgi:hypothetical protein
MWWIILLSIIGYLIMSIITGLLLMYIGDNKAISIFGILWPTALPLCIIEIVCCKIYDKFLK